MHAWAEALALAAFALNQPHDAAAVASAAAPPEAAAKQPREEGPAASDRDRKGWSGWSSDAGAMPAPRRGSLPRPAAPSPSEAPADDAIAAGELTHTSLSCFSLAGFIVASVPYALPKVHQIRFPYATRIWFVSDCPVDVKMQQLNSAAISATNMNRT